MAETKTLVGSSTRHTTPAKLVPSHLAPKLRRTWPRRLVLLEQSGSGEWLSALHLASTFGSSFESTSPCSRLAPYHCEVVLRSMKKAWIPASRTAQTIPSSCRTPSCWAPLVTLFSCLPPSMTTPAHPRPRDRLVHLLVEDVSKPRCSNLKTKPFEWNPERHWAFPFVSLVASGLPPVDPMPELSASLPLHPSPRLIPPQSVADVLVAVVSSRVLPWVGSALPVEVSLVALHLLSDQGGRWWIVNQAFHSVWPDGPSPRDSFGLFLEVSPKLGWWHSAVAPRTPPNLDHPNWHDLVVGVLDLYDKVVVDAHRP